MLKKLLKRVVVTLCVVGCVSSLPVSAEPKAEDIVLSKSRLEMKVGDKLHIKSDGNAKVEVYLPSGNTPKSIIVTAENKKIIKVKKIKDTDYQISALKKGNTTLTIQSGADKQISTTLEVFVKGKAKAKPKPMVHLTADNFEKEVVNYKGKVVIDFSAKWCYYCQLLEPIFEEARKKTPECKFCHVNIDNSPELADLYEVQSVPVMVLHKNGEPIKARGYSQGMTSDDLVNWIKK